MFQVARRRLLTLGLVVIAAPAMIAHHSGAMFDRTRPLVLEGVVKEFRWVNPHSILLIETNGAGGQPPVLWAVEMSSPGNMTRMGWTRTSVSVNEPVEVTVNPMRDGSHGGGCQRVKLLDKDMALNCAAGDAIRSGEKTNTP